MFRFSIISLSLCSLLLNGAPLSQEEIVIKGNQISATLLQKLGGEVKAQMQTNGVMGALHYCTQNALLLTDNVAKDSGSIIKRVSINNRNPINEANKGETIVLSKWEEKVKNKEVLPAYEIEKLSNGDFNYYKPIVINNEACLKCHGDIAQDSPLAEAIKVSYPNDKAMGYKMGDLRGMVVVTLPKER
jgi:hypothetical protein